MTQSKFANLVGAKLLGLSAGMRSLTPDAVMVVHHQLHTSRLVGRLIAVGAATELVLDKLPTTPSRTAPPGFMARLISGAVVGFSASGVTGPLVSVPAAAFSTVTMHRVRQEFGTRTGIPDPVVGVFEDLLAIGVAELGARLGADRAASEPR